MWLGDFSTMDIYIYTHIHIFLQTAEGEVALWRGLKEMEKLLRLACLVFILFSTVCTCKTVLDRSQFPPSFLWGTATSSYQVGVQQEPTKFDWYNSACDCFFQIIISSGPSSLEFTVYEQGRKSVFTFVRCFILFQLLPRKEA